MSLSTKIGLGVFILACAALVTMAWFSPFDAHPDERLHVDAAAFYRNHWLPPRVGEPEARDSYSKYGYSYLDDPDVVYLLFGKSANLLARTLPAYKAERLVNVGLFLLLGACLAVLSVFSDAALPGLLFLSPQLWYVFSYVNGDAFAFFIGTVFSAACAVRLRVLRLRSAELTAFFDHWAVQGSLLGVLILSKKNYWVLIPMAAALALWDSFRPGDGSRRAGGHWLKAAALAAAVACCKLGPQEWANGFHLARNRLLQKELWAQPGYKPSQWASSASPWFLSMYSKGASPWDLLVKHAWLRTSYESFSGVYGWMAYVSPSWMYAAFAVLHVSVCAAIFAPVLKTGTRDEKALALICGATALASVGLSFLNSWVLDFQAQGRYLFPAVSAVLPVLAISTRRGARDPLPWLFCAAGVLSLASFALVGLPSCLG